MNNDVSTNHPRATPPISPPFSGLNLSIKDDPPRSKTSLRIKYEAEAQVIRRQVGTLEEVRLRLGLTQRKMCQLILVDPSAWTRWLKDEDRVPPHIWRALQWYLELEQKQPQWAEWREYVLKRQASADLSGFMREIQAQIEQASGKPANLSRLEDEVQRLREQNQALLGSLESREALGLGWKLLLILNSLALAYWALRSIW